MIHLDTNLLIGVQDTTDLHHPISLKVFGAGDHFACSAVVWMDLLSFQSDPCSSNEKVKAT